MITATLECGHKKPMPLFWNTDMRVTVIRCDQCNNKRRKIAWMEDHREENE